jgi:hypothetical protein
MIDSNLLNKAWLFYVRGIELQMEYENKPKTEENLTLLNEIVEHNKKLYTLIRDNKFS